MKKSFLLSLASIALLVSCGGDRSEAAEQQAFETVQEGAVAGVTTSIGGPGESLPPITGTNADTTTAFTLDPKAVGAPLPPPASNPYATFLRSG